MAGPERHVEEATLSASGPTALRGSGVAADLRKTVGDYWHIGNVPLPMPRKLRSTSEKTKYLGARDSNKSLLIITDNPNATHFSHRTKGYASPLLCGVENDAITPFALGPIKRNVGTLDHALRGVTRTFIERHANRDCYR